MRAARFFAAISLTAGLVTAVACQEPTQVTIDVRLATAKCAEIHGTAITVGIRAEATESEVKSKSPHAQTTDCDDTTSRIGTLVITPSDEGRASVIVVTSYGNQRDPTACQPPLYADCIVARRQFTFIKHRRLSLPITIDPTCVNVPCDAFSTCRKGFCFTAEVSPCEGSDDCLEPGATVDGGTDPNGALDGSSPDAFADGTAQDDSSTTTDSGGDADGTASDGDTGTVADTGQDTGPGGPDAGGMSCDGNQRIICPTVPTACALSGTMACCTNAALMTTCQDTTASAGNCPSSHAEGRWCCSDPDCGPNLKCPPSGSNAPRQCCFVQPVIDGGQMRAPVPQCLP